MTQKILAGILLVSLLGTSPNAQLLHRYDFATTNDSVGTAHGALRGSATISSGALNTSAVAGGLSGGVMLPVKICSSSELAMSGLCDLE